jgi:transcription initiation factor TFIIF subunit beta
MADTYIKPEIKPDPDALGASPSAFEEDDIYEDAGDLDFNNDPQYQSLYLARVPKYVWEAWSKLDDDAEIQIGTIRMTSIIDEKTKKEKVIPHLHG